MVRAVQKEENRGDWYETVVVVNSYFDVAHSRHNNISNDWGSCFLNQSDSRHTICIMDSFCICGCRDLDSRKDTV